MYTYTPARITMVFIWNEWDCQGVVARTYNLICTDIHTVCDNIIYIDSMYYLKLYRESSTALSLHMDRGGVRGKKVFWRQKPAS